MKKVICLSLLLLITIGIISNVYAASTCDISARTSKNTFNKEEEFTVDFVVSNIQSEKGIIAIGAVLEYDKDSLTLIKMEGQNGWETPSYNESNGNMAFTRNMLSKNDETFLRITFKVNKKSKANLTITLSDIKVGDGVAPATVKDVTKQITVNDGTIPTTSPTTTPTVVESPTPNTSKNPSAGGDNTIKNERLPQTGIDNTVLQISIALTVIATLGFYIKIKTINKKANKN